MSSEPVALVNEPFARKYFDGGVPAGRRVRIWSAGEPGPWRTVVGVAPHLWMDTDVNVAPEGVYAPLAQAPQQWAQVAVRVEGDPSAFGLVLRETVARLDPNLPVLEVQTMTRLIRGRTRFYRFHSPPLIAVGLAAVLLAIAGLHAVVSYLASLRAKEYGIRAAVGAGRSDLIRRSVASVALPTSVGLMVGLPAGLSLVRGFDRWLFLVDPLNPWVAAATLAILVVGTGLSALAPALRASRVDLRQILRTE